MKSAPKKAPAVAPSINDNVNYAAAATILRTLENGLTAIEAEVDALRIEDHLGASSAQGSTRNARNAVLRARLDKHRAEVPAEDAFELTPDGLPKTVTAALQIIRGSRPATRVNRRGLIKQLESDRDVIRAAIIAQHTIVEELRNELSGDISRRLMDDYRKRVLAQFRAAQAFAFATDVEAEFRESVIGAGYIWRADLLQAPQLRAALVLGSESTFDSDISRARRMLEELKIL